MHLQSGGSVTWPLMVVLLKKGGEVDGGGGLQIIPLWRSLVKCGQAPGVVDFWFSLFVFGLVEARVISSSLLGSGTLGWR